MDIHVSRSSLTSKTELIHDLVTSLTRIGYVKPSYEEAINKRELEFPTGLELEGSFNVAIPHAETDHVLKPAIHLTILESQILWENMEDPDEKVPVHLVFLLCIKKPELVVPNLKALTDNIFSKPDIVAFLKTETDENKIKEQLEKLVSSKREKL
ncbi:MAG: PTS sugar transporter subunit IIA [Candidatus Hodarchaeales archaeon]|jgi:PTS system galactitol-specific IIA component